MLCSSSLARLDLLVGRLQLLVRGLLLLDQRLQVLAGGGELLGQPFDLPLGILARERRGSRLGLGGIGGIGGIGGRAGPVGRLEDDQELGSSNGPARTGTTSRWISRRPPLALTSSPSCRTGTPSLAAF